MAISINTVAPVLAAQEAGGIAPELVLQPGSVVNAQVLKILSADLVRDWSDDEVAVVVAHELAHHAHHDLWRTLALDASLLSLGLLVADRVAGLSRWGSEAGRQWGSGALTLRKWTWKILRRLPKS